MGCTQSQERVDDLEKQLAAEKLLSETYRASALEVHVRVKDIRNRFQRIPHTFDSAALESLAPTATTAAPLVPGAATHAAYPTIDSIRTELDELVAAAWKAESALTTACADAKRLVDDHQTLKAEIASLQHALQQKAQHADFAKIALSHEEAAKLDALEQLTALQILIAGKEGEIERLHAELAEQRVERNAHLQEVLQLSERADELSIELEECRSRLHAVEVFEDERTSEWSLRARTAEARAAEAQEALVDATNQTAALESTSAARLHELQSALAVTNAEVESLETRLERQETQFNHDTTQLREEMELKLTEFTATAKADRDLLEAENRRLRQELSVMAQTAAEAANAAASLQQDIAARDEQLRDAEKRHAEALERLTHRRDVAHELRRLLKDMQSTPLHDCSVTRSDWSGVWRLAQRVAADPTEPAEGDQFKPAYEAMCQFLNTAMDVASVTVQFFTGESEAAKPYFHALLGLTVVADLLADNDPARAKAAAAAFKDRARQLARSGEECVKQRGDSILFQAVADIHTGRAKHPTGRQGFSLLAAGAEIYTFLMELSKKSRVAELCDVGALAVTHIVEPFKAALKARLPAVGSPATTEAWAKSIVETYEWVNDRRTKEGGIAQLGAKPAEFGKLLNEAVDELFSQVKSMRTVKDIRDAIWSMGKDEVLQLPPFQRLEGVDLRVIADQWDAASAAKHTMASSDGPTPCEETAEAQARLAERVERVAEQMHAGVDRYMVRGLVTAASAATVRAELKQAAQAIAAVAMANPRDVEAQLSLIAMACVIASWCMTPTSGVRDLVKMDDVSEREKGLLLVPHRLQLAAVLRVFGLHTASEADFLADALAGSTNVAAHLAAFRHNHLVEVGTGQGKSLILGVIGIAAGLVGIDVDIVCFNRLLSRRDRAAMSGFDCGVAGVECGISYFLDAKAPRYLTFTELAHELVADLRDRAGRLLRRDKQPKLAVRESQSSSSSSAAALKRLILVDEVDAFFEIANQSYTAGVVIDIDATRGPLAELCELLYKHHGDCAGLEDRIAGLQAAIVRGLPAWVAEDFGREFVAQVVQDLVTKAPRVVGSSADAMNNFGHAFDRECEIGMVDESDFFDPNFRDTYIAPFLYWRETSRVGGALSESKCGELKKAVHSLRVALPPVTYSWLLKHCYMGMIGLSGTLRTLPASLLDYMQQPHLLGPIKKWTFVPPVHLLQQHTTGSGNSSSTSNGVGMVQRATQVPWTQVHSSQVMCTSFKPAVALYDHTQDCAPYVERIMRSADPEAEWSATITDAIRSHRSLTRAVVGGGQVLVVFDDAARLQQYVRSVAGSQLVAELGVDQVVVLSQGLSREQVEERVANAMKPRTVTLMTRSYGRGTDFKAGKRDVVLVVQTFVSRTVSDEIQIRGRTARADRAGRCVLIFSPTHLASLGVTGHLAAAVAVVKQDLAAGIINPAHTVLVPQRDRALREKMTSLQSSIAQLKRSSADFLTVFDTDCDTATWIDVLRKHNIHPPVNPELAAMTIDFVIDVSLSMKMALSPTDPLPRHVAVTESLASLYSTVLQNLGPVKWNLFVFGNQCFRYSGTDGRPYTFEDASVTPHGVLAEHLRTKGYQMGTLFLPAAQQLTDAIRDDSSISPRAASARPQHFVFWFTDGRPDDCMTDTINFSYETALFGPCRELYGTVRDRVALFQAVLFCGANEPQASFDAVRCFAEAWGGTAERTTGVDEFAEVLLAFGQTVRPSQLR